MFLCVCTRVVYHPFIINRFHAKQIRFVNLMTDTIAGKVDQNRPVTANAVFQAQSNSAKAIRDVQQSETSLLDLEEDSIGMQERMETDLVFVESIQVLELKSKLVTMVKLRHESSQASAQAWDKVFLPSFFFFSHKNICI